ncbi:hypothetical protein Sango_0024100 [Sesamum angolense]|uniref:Uncharacterized protein n=1 Tax=Sesamum angolense TaxID=2727404 RepID=A0AAE1XCQ3_9LAMI|nr:hypothetical protein Sango_0024100 [Sesamum angolense]
MESEFITLDKAGEEAEWLRNFLEDIPCWTKPVPAIMVHCDSQLAIGRAQSSMYNGRESLCCCLVPCSVLCVQLLDSSLHDDE